MMTCPLLVKRLDTRLYHKVGNLSGYQRLSIGKMMTCKRLDTRLYHKVGTCQVIKD